MTRVLSEKVITARKNHPCDAYYIFKKSKLNTSTFSEDQLKLLTLAELEGYQILQGQEYLAITLSENGGFCSYKARLDMHTLIKQLGLLED